MKQFIKLIANICLCLIALIQVKAQNDNPCTQPWGDWITVYQFSPGAEFQISFKYLIRNRKNGECSESFYRISNPIVEKGAYLEFKFDYRQKDGTVATRDLSCSLDKEGIHFDNTADWYLGYEYIRIYSAVIKSPNKDKAISLTDDVNISVINYGKQYNDAILQANKVKEPAKHNQLIRQIDDNKELFHKYKEQAQVELNKGNGDAMAQALDKMKQQQNELHAIFLRIDPDEPATAENNAIANNKNTPIKSIAPQANTNNNQQQETRRQIMQEQQEMQAKTNQTIQNSMQQGTDAVKNFANFLAEENAGKAQGQAAYDERMQRVNETLQKERASRELSNFETLDKAAEKGDSSAMFSLATSYRKGDNGVSVNMQQSVFWYHRAAEHGKIEAQVFLCNLYYYGSIFYFKGGDTIKDHTKSLYWGEKSLFKKYVAENGIEDPQYILQRVYIEDARKSYKNNDLDEALFNYRNVLKLSGAGLENEDRNYLVKLILKNKISLQEIENSSTSIPEYRYLSLIRNIYFGLANSYQFGEDAIADHQQAIVFYQKVIDLKDLAPKYEWLRKDGIAKLARKHLKELKK